jgi:hypothetical protein
MSGRIALPRRNSPGTGGSSRSPHLRMAIRGLKHDEKEDAVGTDPQAIIENVTAEPTALITLRLDAAAAEALDDLLTQGRGRPRGMPPAPLEAALRRELRKGIRQLHGTTGPEGALALGNGTPARSPADGQRDVREQLEAVRADLARYRTALRRIAAAESGPWGWIAHEALSAPAEGQM